MQVYEYVLWYLEFLNSSIVNFTIKACSQQGNLKEKKIKNIDIWNDNAYIFLRVQLSRCHPQ